ncbi:TVP38/TMEM64 family protein [Aureibacillus halotolerans]|uniref:TVP38/TMEM64 family membrane protein n=1 Tax=Aureibacillus halotolerans TaxID=1508390 RepID=A0A4V3D600_9BACI|nr:TVP38/TMEM64 family protein [Aureibacillus halotolerans]TDQ42057.1 putative membrane protein YdjX (TVP38/TMEM64 family) [Aureibacillus halotolerans]
MEEWITQLNEWVSSGNVEDIVQEYRSYGFLLGFFLPFIEAFLPFLPAVLFGIANAQAFGLIPGFLLSWAGAVAGSFCVFIIVRYIGDARFLRVLREQKQIKRMTLWVKKRGFGPLFLLLCFPFSPSSVINVVAALSRVNIYQFLLALMLGKAVMYFLISYVGHDFRELIQEPLKTVVVLIVIGLLWWVGKRAEKRMQSNVRGL